MTPDPLSDAPETPASPSRADLPLRRDALPPWVVVLLALFLLSRLYTGLIAPAWAHKAASSASPTLRDPASAGLDSDSLEDLLQTDLLAKTAFVSTLAHAGTVVQPDTSALRNALKSAEQLQTDSHNAPSAARRVILLRALLPAQSAGPPLASRPHGLDPLAAYGASLPPGVSASDRASLAREAHLWQTVFGGGRLSPRQTAQTAAQIERLPNIRWWRYPALMALYTAQGDVSEAQRCARAARQDALPSLVPFGLVSALRLGLMLLGLALLGYLLLRRTGTAGASGGAPGNDLWPTAPVPIEDAQRRLGAGDLMGVFVLYLIAQEGIVLLLTGFGVPRVFHWGGLLGPFRPRLALLTAAQRSLVGVALESVVYLLSAALPLGALWGMARRRGASLADELGWSGRHLGTNALYGIGGFAIASALMLPVALLARALFRHAPDPSNPVIPQLAGALGGWTIALLVGLATIAAPLVEELLFRGVFYQAARLRLGAWPAIVLTGLVFGFVHPVGIAEMLAIGTLGGVFAWMAETRKSLAPSIVGHCLNNLTSVLLLLFILAG